MRRLHVDDGSGVRAASGVAPLGDGWLVAQDDAAHAAWRRDRRGERVRIVPEVEGEVAKVEGLAVVAAGEGHDRLLAVVDDDPDVASLALELRVRWG